MFHEFTFSHASNYNPRKKKSKKKIHLSLYNNKNNNKLNRTCSYENKKKLRESFTSELRLNVKCKSSVT